MARQKSSVLAQYRGKQKKLVAHVDNITAYAMAHDCTYVLGRGMISLSVFEQVILVYQKAERNACSYLETMVKYVNLVFHTQIIVERIAVKVVRLKGVQFQDRAAK